MEQKKVVKINGQEIEVPEGFEVVVTKSGNIRVVRSNSQDIQKVRMTEVDISEIALSEAKSIDLPVDEKVLKKNVKKLYRLNFYAQLIVGVLAGLIFTGISIGILVVSYVIMTEEHPSITGGLFLSFIGLLVLVMSLYHLYNVWKLAQPLFTKKKEKDN